MVPVTLMVAADWPIERDLAVISSIPHAARSFEYSGFGRGA